jgi:hypothetical protein
MKAYWTGAVVVLPIVLACTTPEASLDGSVVDLAEPRATSSVDRSQEFGSIEFLRLTFQHLDLPPDMYEFRLAANGREWRCEFMFPFRSRRIHEECFFREYPNLKQQCPEYCGEHCTKGFPDASAPVCSGDLHIDLTSVRGQSMMFLQEVPDVIEFSVLRDGEVAYRETVRPEYRLFAPNEAAQPVCRQAGVELGR